MLNLANPWDDVYKNNAHVLGKPYSGFNHYLEVIQRSGCKNILDLGCGTGRHAVPLYNLSYRPYCFDISGNAISFLRDQVAILCSECVNRISVNDMFEKFPYSDNFFDTVLSIAVVYHGTACNIHRAFAEVARVLRPGGIFYFTTSVDINHSKTINDGSNYVQIERNTFLPLDGREKYLVHHYFTEVELRDYLSTDFQDISITFDGDNYFEVYCKKR